MKKTTQLKLESLIRRIVEEETINDSKYYEVADKLVQFFRSGNKQKVFNLLKTAKYDSEMNLLTNVEELSREFNSTSDVGTKNYVRVALTR